jgi:hypothetical protein
VLSLERPIDVFSVEIVNYTKQTNMLWVNCSFIFRVKREGKQITFKLRLIFKISFAANKVKIALFCDVTLLTLLYKGQGFGTAC